MNKLEKLNEIQIIDTNLLSDFDFENFDLKLNEEKINWLFSSSNKPTSHSTTNRCLVTNKCSVNQK